MRRSVIALVSFLFVLPVQANATARIRLTSDWNYGYVCNVSSGSNFAIVTAILEYTSATGVAFAVSVDPASGYVLQSYGSTFDVTGDVTSGVDINFGRCIDYPVHVMQFVLVRASAGEPCSYFSLAPHPAYGMTTYTDCLSIRREARHGSGVILNSTADQARPPRPLQRPGRRISKRTWSGVLMSRIAARRFRATGPLCFGTTPDPPMNGT
jgi:hypothetical protein